MIIIDGLQTRGVYGCRCAVNPESINIGALWVRDVDRGGQVVSLVDSDGNDRYTVQLPENPPFFSQNVTLKRVDATTV